jgi:ABC-type Na+ efflux pump permease subunit
LASIIYTLATLALIASASNKRGLLRFCGWSILLVLGFTFVAVYFKVDNYFSFIPFKKLAAAASRIIHYRWMGWALIATGGLIMILFSGKNKK